MRNIRVIMHTICFILMKLSMILHFFSQLTLLGQGFESLVTQMRKPRLRDVKTFSQAAHPTKIVVN